MIDEGVVLDGDVPADIIIKPFIESVLGRRDSTHRGIVESTVGNAEVIADVGSGVRLLAIYYLIIDTS